MGRPNPASFIGLRDARLKRTKNMASDKRPYLAIFCRNRRLNLSASSGTFISRTTAIVLRSSKIPAMSMFRGCLLYTSDAADDLLCVDLGGRRIIKKKKKKINR